MLNPPTLVEHINDFVVNGINALSSSLMDLNVNLN